MEEKQNWLDAEKTELGFQVNDKQYEFIEQLYRLDVNRVGEVAVVGGIGAGKSVMLAFVVWAMKEELPKAKIMMPCNTVKQLKTKFSPQLKAALSKHLCCEPYNWETGEGEYVLWRQPPAHFDKPYEAPDDWSNCISFPNGTVFEACGFRNAPDDQRGPNYDGALLDEASFFNRDWLKIVRGRIRANVGKYHSPLHLKIFYFSSPAYSRNGQYLYEIEELEKENPGIYLFKHFKTRDNQVFLPADYIPNLKRTLPSHEYDVEVDGLRITRLPRTFYPSLNELLHCDIDALVDANKWYNPNDYIVVSVDFNAHFCSATIWQEEGRMSKMIRVAYTKEAIDNLTMAKTLGVKIADEMSDHVCKRVVVTGDRNGQNKSAGTNMTMFEQLAEQLEMFGWDVTLCPLYFNLLHKDKYTMVNNVLAEGGHNDIVIRIDPDKCRSAIISMNNSPINETYEKVKDSETRKSVSQEQATHISDTVDYYITYKKVNPMSSGSGGFDISFI